MKTHHRIQQCADRNADRGSDCAGIERGVFKETGLKKI